MLVEALPILRVDAPGTRMAVREAGSGPPLVLLHGGMGTSLHDWAPVVPPLAERFRIVMVDHRGHGDSSLGSGPVGHHRFGLDLVHVLRACGIGRAAFMGFSVGANTLLELLAPRPGLARGLVLIGGSAQGDPERIGRLAERPWPQELLGLHAGAADDPGYTAWLRRALIRNWVAHCSMPDGELARVTCPALVCHGHDDRVQPLAVAIHLARALPHGELLVVPRAGHAVQLDRPDVFLRGVGPFLERVSGRPARGG